MESYNEFFDTGLPQLLREKNPIHFFKNQEKIIIDKETRFVDFTLSNGRELPLTRDEMIERFPDDNEIQSQHRWENAKEKGLLKH